MDAGPGSLDPGYGNLGPYPQVPGEVIYSRASPFTHLFGPNRIYTTSPSIVVLSPGTYLVSFNLFGDSLSPPSDQEGTTLVFRSTDQGRTWSNLTPQPMMGMKRGSLFTRGGSVFLWGYTASPGEVVIRRSDDRGTSWTIPRGATTGLLTTQQSSGTPSNPAVLNGRLWFPAGGKRFMSVPAGADLLDAASWAGPSRAANTDTGPLGSNLVVSEAQIVASPDAGVVVLPKVDGLPYTVLLRATGNQALADPSAEDWVPLPGGDKKFGAAWDPVSGRFYVLSNPVLPAHANHPFLTRQLIRNTAALLSSADLRRWDVHELFLYSPNVDYEAFQYFNFDFEGDDLVIASRTAFDIGTPRPPRGHDSNLVTFHRLRGFRQARPRFVLESAGGRLRRVELTQHEPAPWGAFALGASFDGLPLGDAFELGQDAAGDVFIREVGGRLLRFDALGNFLGAVGTAPVPLRSPPLTLAPPPEGLRTWAVNRGGNWADLDAWFRWGRPDTFDEVAVLGSAVSSAQTLSIDDPLELGGLRFLGPSAYTLAGAGRVRLGARQGSAPLEALRGAHRVALPVRLEGTVAARAWPGAALVLTGAVDCAGRALEVRGEGRLEVAGPLGLSGGRVVVHGPARLALRGASSTLDGTLEYRLRPGPSPVEGDTFEVLEVPTGFTPRFASLALPPLPPGLDWSTAELYVTGRLRVVRP